jgi:endonuclease YncB( thermonuclease family)
MMRTLIAIAALATITANPAMADKDLDWMRAQVEDDLGIDVADRAKVPTSSVFSRKDLVNFSLTANIKDIDDGDTIDLVGKGGARFVIRFSDLDTPEVSHKEFKDPKCDCNSMAFRPGQPGGKAATQSLLELVKVGDEVTAECYEPDKYGRFACHIFKGGMNVNLEQIRRGLGLASDEETMGA